MSSTTPDLSGLEPFLTVFIDVAAIGAAISLVIIGQTLVAFATVRRTRPARAASIAAH